MITERKQKFEEFIHWFDKHITGDEKGEGQIFLERFIQSFGNKGIKEVGAVCEDRVKKKSGFTGFADLVWKPRMILELKKRGENLSKHYDQAFEYWISLVPNRPRYMVLCNFDEFWIYDLNTQINDPIHKLEIKNISKEWGALAFLFPVPEEPVFNNNNVEVTKQAAAIVGSLFVSLTKRNVDPVRAQRFVLQLVVALFAEDVDLIPKYTLNKILKEAVANPVTQTELTDLFRAMSTDSEKAKVKKYKEIPYFNGGLFNDVDAVELLYTELDLLNQASMQDWSKVRPSIFGSIFESSMDVSERHSGGVHFTSELDIQKIVYPTIVRPFRNKIENAKTKKDLLNILVELQEFKVLDPACGSGNFLYISYRELVRIEMDVMKLLHEKYSNKKVDYNPDNIGISRISSKNFYGIDTNGFGIELAKISLSIGRKLAADEFLLHDNILPFENLDSNIVCNDALFYDWPQTDVIIGNPPFQAKNKMLQKFGVDYLNKLRTHMPEVSGNADYCVYWFKKAHDKLAENQRAGFVGTNTIRQNYSRESGLDYIVSNGGTITEAVATQVWSGDATVHVSIVNWMRGALDGKKKLYIQKGDLLISPWEIYELDKIPSNLSPNFDVTTADEIKFQGIDVCIQGQTPGHDGFLLPFSIGRNLLSNYPEYRTVLFPYLIGDDLLGTSNKQPSRYIIDFGKQDINYASSFTELFNIVRDNVLPWRQKKADEEKIKNEKARLKNPKAKIDKQYVSALNRWWILRRSKEELISQLGKIDRYIVTSRVTKRPIFDFVSSQIHPGDSLQAFLLDDDYSFGVLQSSCHWTWFNEKCSTMKGDPRYTSESVFDTFPWPQSPSLDDVDKVTSAARDVITTRNQILTNNPKTCLRELYKNLELPGKNILRDAHDALSKAVINAYGFGSEKTLLESLFELNKSLSSVNKASVQGPGLPRCVEDKTSYISGDCIRI